MCNTATDIESIITEFIKSVYAFEKQWTLDSYEATQLLKKHFDFDLPEAVVKTCLNKLKKKGFVEKREGKYAVVDTTFNAQTFFDKLNLEKDKQERLENELVEYFEHLLGTKIEQAVKKELIDSFISYLLDKNVPDQYSTIISSYVIGKSKIEGFVLTLNQIKEGLVLITGLRYTDDLMDIGRWNDELTIYLDTEHLFNSAGYNGVVFERLFDDFHSLVKEINVLAQNTFQKKLIHLKYFESVNEEVDNFFGAAERIIKRADNSSPENTAMEEICRGCSNVSDILRKKADFEAHLKTRGISLLKDLEYYSKPEYNIEDQHLIEKYKDTYEENVLVNALHNFTKVNFLRRGINRTRFERCKHVMMTGKTATLVLSRDLEIKNEAKDIPFASDIYFITNRMWFKLNKGLSKSARHPSTLDIVTKAKIVLSSQVNRSVDKKYEDLKTDLSSGKINKEQAQEYYHILREKATRPEEITGDNVDKSIEFIFDDDLEKYMREKSALKQKAEEGEKAIHKLNQIQSIERSRRKQSRKLLTRCVYYGSIFIFVALVIGLSFGIWHFVKDLKTDHDTPIGVYGFVFAIIVELFGLLKWVRPLHRRLKQICKKYYLDAATKLG